jgi:hypothetical protein
MERDEVYRRLTVGDNVGGKEVEDFQLALYYFYHTADDPDMFALALGRVPLTYKITDNIFSFRSLHPRSFQMLMSIDLPPKPADETPFLETIAIHRSAEEFDQALTAFGDDDSNILHLLTRDIRFHSISNYYNTKKKIEICLRRGVDPLRCDEHMRTPLYYALPCLVHLFLPYVHFDSLPPSAPRPEKVISEEEVILVPEPQWRCLPNLTTFPDEEELESARVYLAHHGNPLCVTYPFRTLEEAADNGNKLAKALLQ